VPARGRVLLARTEPQYFLNPPAYSYPVHLVLELWFGSGGAVSRA
jgi:hypothetical protein